MSLKVVCISDTHMSHEELKMPEGDILVHSGDFSGMTNYEELIELNRWFGTLDYREIYLVPGNHDGQFAENADAARALIPEAKVLIDQGAEFDGYKIWGSPWTAKFYDWWFMQHPDKLIDYWKLIPDDTDILLTHQPPFGLLDTVMRHGSVGCPHLRQEVITRVKPLLHVYGHLHLDGGKWVEHNGTIFVNAAVNNEYYNVTREPVVIEL